MAWTFRDPLFRRFCFVTAPCMFLTVETTIIMPLKGMDARTATVYFCVSAAVVAGVQPWCAASGRAHRRWVLWSGLLSAGTGYVLLITLVGDSTHRFGGLISVAVLNGLSNGLLQPAIFHNIAGYAPASRIGTHLGLHAFLSGAVTFAGGIAVGRLFDIGRSGMTIALAGLGVLAAASALAYRRPLPRATVTGSRGVQDPSG